MHVCIGVCMGIYMYVCICMCVGVYTCVYVSEWVIIEFNSAAGIFHLFATIKQ